MKEDIFEGAIIEELANTLDKASKLEPGTKEHNAAVQDIKELSMIQLENEVKAEELRLKKEEVNALKKKNKMDFWKNIGLGAAYTGTGFILMKYNLKEGTLQGRDGMKFFDMLKNLIKH